MAGDIRVGRKLEFYAPHTRMGRDAVVQGRHQEAMVHFVDDFMYDTMDTGKWAASVGNGGNAPAIVVGANGLVNICTNGAASDVTEMYGEAIWYPRQHITIEARLYLTDITTVNAAFGLVNAASNTNDKDVCAIGGSDALTLGTNITDAAVFLFDTAGDTDRWFAISTINAAAAQGGVLATGITPVNSTFEVFRIDVDKLGNATFYRNGAVVKYIATAVTTTTALRPYLAILTHASAARSLFCDYIEGWQNRAETATVIW